MYMQSCGVCKSTNLYTAFPSGILYCGNCGNKAAAVPSRNEQPDPSNLDIRKKSTPKKLKPLRPVAAKQEAPAVTTKAERRKMRQALSGNTL